MKRPIILLLFFFPTCICADAIKNLATTLKDIAQPQNVGLLGPRLEQHHPEVLIPTNLFYLPGRGSTTLTFALAFLDNEQKKLIEPIYQLKVLQQGKRECGIHAFRNALYLIDMLQPHANFDKIYNQMMQDEKGYEQFIAKIGCLRDVGSRDEDIKRIKEKINSSSFATCIPDCIPEQSPKYINYIFDLNYYVRFGGALEKHPEHVDFEKIIDEQIATTEPNLKITADNNFIVLDISSLLENDVNPSFVNSVRTFCSSPNGLLVWYLGIFTTHGFMGETGGLHGVTLAQHKYNNKTEYIFADSNNFKISDDYGSSQIINRVVSLTKNVDYFDNTLVRFIYYELIYYIETYGSRLAGGDAKGLERAFTRLESLNLLNSKLYISTYKSAFCNLAKKLKNKNLGYGAYYDDLLKKFKCT